MNRRQLLGGIALGGAVSATAMAAEPLDAGQRISTEAGDAGERLYAQLCGDNKIITVWLDGIEQENAVMADPARGELKRAVTTPSGNIAINKATGEIYYETVKGRVRWAARDGQYYKRPAPVL